MHCNKITQFYANIKAKPSTGKSQTNGVNVSSLHYFPPLMAIMNNFSRRMRTGPPSRPLLLRQCRWTGKIVVIHTLYVLCFLVDCVF